MRRVSRHNLDRKSSKDALVEMLADQGRALVELSALLVFGYFIVAVALMVH